MSDTPNSDLPKTVPAREILGKFWGDAKLLSVGALVSMLGGLVLPVVSLKVSAFGMSQSTPVHITDASGGFFATVVVLGFVAAVAALYVAALLPYRRFVGYGALALWAAMLVSSLVFADNAYSQVAGAAQAFGGFMGGPARSAMSNAFSIVPNIGSLFFLLAPFLLFRSIRKA